VGFALAFVLIRFSIVCTREVETLSEVRVEINLKLEKIDACLKHSDLLVLGSGRETCFPR